MALLLSKKALARRCSGFRKNEPVLCKDSRHRRYHTPLHGAVASSSLMALAHLCRPNMNSLKAIVPAWAARMPTDTCAYMTCGVTSDENIPYRVKQPGQPLSNRTKREKEMDDETRSCEADDLGTMSVLSACKAPPDTETHKQLIPQSDELMPFARFQTSNCLCLYCANSHHHCSSPAPQTVVLSPPPICCTQKYRSSLRQARKSASKQRAAKRPRIAGIQCSQGPVTAPNSSHALCHMARGEQAAGMYGIRTGASANTCCISHYQDEPAVLLAFLTDS